MHLPIDTHRARLVPECVSAIGMGFLAIAFSSWVLLTLPTQAAVILTLAGVLAWVAWMRTTYAHPVASRKVIATYLLAVAFQFVHMSEEYVGDFPHELVQLFNSPRDWSERSFLLTFVFGFGTLWVLAAAGALYRVAPRITCCGSTPSGPDCSMPSRISCFRLSKVTISPAYIQRVDIWS
jgi:hypothetical protein